MNSISEKPVVPVLPDFRRFGTWLRVLIGANLLAIAGAVTRGATPTEWWQAYLAMASVLQPTLLLVVLLLAGSCEPLRRLAPRVGQGVVLAGAVLVALLVEDALHFIGLGEGSAIALLRTALLTAAITGLLLFYFELRARTEQPANTAARLAALTARIRPHFLFNSLNAVLSLIRDNPRQAESALESLAELYRVLMRDPGELAPLSEEIALCRQYLDLERLRLGERLRVHWDIAEIPADARVPALMLQPLIENAVYHGIEPAPEGGDVSIRFARDGDDLLVSLSNPLGKSPRHSEGNHMALANIRERLLLHYDVDARLTIDQDADRFRVTIRIPRR